MSKLIWDKTGERLYETGTKKGVIYPQVKGAYPKGAAWNGLISFTESPDGGEATDYYADDQKYISIRSKENFKGTITAYMYPDEFAECNGEAQLTKGVTVGQQVRKPFGFSYQTVIGNDTDFEDHGYKIHLIYGATAAPSEKSYSTMNDNPEPVELSWEIDTLPVEITGFKPTAHIEIDSTKVDATKLAKLEEVLYGTEETEARLPLPDEVLTILNAA